MKQTITATTTFDRPPRVLLVEDDFTSREFLRRVLEKTGCAVAAADCVHDAQRLFNERGAQGFDTVLTDYRMPGLTGLDLLEWVKQRDSCLTTILLTAEGEKKLVTASLRAGASDFLEKPVNLDKLLPALNKAVATTQRLRELAAVESAVTDLGRAQNSLIHSRRVAIPGHGEATVDVCFHPKVKAGGDFFTHFQPAPDKFCCLLTDVSGHDLQAAYVSAHFQGIVRGMLQAGAAIPEIFRFFNRFLIEEWNPSGQFRLQSANTETSVAALSVLVDFRKHTVNVLTCGAPAPILIAPDGRARCLGETGGSALGWFPDWQGRGVAHPTADGGRIVLWTDGLEDLARQLEIHPLCLAHKLEEAKASGERLALLDEASDDILLANLRLPKLAGAPLEEDFYPLLVAEYHGGQADEIDVLSDWWLRHLRAAFPDINESSQHDVLLAAREAVLNAMEHGCQGAAENHVRFQISCHAARRLIRIWVEDPGSGHQFDFTAHATTAAEKIIDEHRGLIFITNLAQTVKFERCGATVIMEFKID